MQIEIRPNTDLFTVDADAIAHGCNCLGVMGAGVALQVKIRYPEVYQSYKDYVKRMNYSKDILPGTAQCIETEDKTIFNLFTQYEMGRHAKAEYIAGAFAEMFGIAQLSHISTIAIPMIGAGIGGMKWEDVLLAIEQAENAMPWNGTLIIAIKD